MFNGKNIVMCVTGGIAVYKAVNLASRLKKMGGSVHIVMTKNATEFVSPLTFKTITKNKVTIDSFDSSDFVAHISLADMADMVIVAPATANIIAKIACGIADDMVSTLLLSVTSPVFVVPAMNTRMFLNEITQLNIKKLIDRGIKVMEPDSGLMACETEGIGRFPEEQKIIDFLSNNPNELQYIKGKNVVVTLGGTREDIDPVRYISNKSSGKMGFAFCDVLIQAGANVRIISANSNLTVFNDFKIKYPKTKIISVHSSKDMKRELEGMSGSYDILIMAAAVSDYIPEYSVSKLKKDGTEELVLKLTKGTDILRELKKEPNVVYVGFAAETENILVNAKEKILKKGVDFIIANGVEGEKSAMGGDRASVTVINRWDDQAFCVDFSDKKIVSQKVLEYLDNKLTTINRHTV